jgi:isopenicillin N synthase-like dioxygenase
MSVSAAGPIPVVDLAPFHEGGVAGKRLVATQVDAACRDFGFLQVTGHGVPVSVCDDLLNAWSGFFELPMAQKLRWVVPDESANRGYSWPGKEALAYSRGEATPPDLMEAFNVGRREQDDPYFELHHAFYAPTVWPDRPPGLRETWEIYDRAASVVAGTVLRAMALALGLPENWFADRCARAIETTRAINYQRRAGAADPEPGQMRMGAHTDYGILTVLLADDVPGLQVFRAGQWQDAPTPSGTLTLNIGDMLALWTNGRWTSTLHRVLPPPPPPAAPAAGPVRRRSVARFLDCEPSQVIECIPSCCGPGNPPRHEPVQAGEWLMAKILRGRQSPGAGKPSPASQSASRTAAHPD